MRRPQTACKLCGQPVHVRDYDKRGVMHYTRRSNHTLCRKCWLAAVRHANLSHE
jgi:hypothetical protein